MLALLINHKVDMYDENKNTPFELPSKLYDGYDNLYRILYKNFHIENSHTTCFASRWFKLVVHGRGFPVYDDNSRSILGAR